MRLEKDLLQMNTNIKSIAIASICTSIWLIASTASADPDCVDTNRRNRWISNDLGFVEPASGNLPINVYIVNTGGTAADSCNVDPLDLGANRCSSALYSGSLTMAAANRVAVRGAVLDAIANWNRASAEIKPLVFMGEVVVADDNFLTLDAALPNQSAVFVSVLPNCDYSGLSTPCEDVLCDGGNTDFKMRVQIAANSCDDTDWTAYPAFVNDNSDGPGDLYGTVFHEFGHVLGLKHTGGTEPGCQFNNSVMNTFNSTGGMRQYRRRARTVDIDMLRFLWSGIPERDLYIGEKTFVQSAAVNAANLSWGLFSGNPSFRTNTPPSTTNAHDEDSRYTVIGYTNSADRVSFTTGLFGAGYNFDHTVLTYPPNFSTAKTYDSVAVNFGSPPGTNNNSDIRVMMAWYDGIFNSSWDLGVRFAIRNFGSTAHTHSGIITSLTFGPRPKTGIGVGVDHSGGRFFVVYADYDYQMAARFYNMGTGAQGATFLPAGPNFHITDIGTPTCVLNGNTTNCSIPVTTSGGFFLGTCAGWVEGSMLNGGSWVFSSVVWDSMCLPSNSMRLANGAPTIATDTREGAFESETHLATFASGGPVYGNSFTLADNVATDGWVVQAPLVGYTQVNTQGWPLAAGSNTSNNDTLNYRLVTGIEP